MEKKKKKSVRRCIAGALPGFRGLGTGTAGNWAETPECGLWKLFISSADKTCSVVQAMGLVVSPCERHSDGENTAITAKGINTPPEFCFSSVFMSCWDFLLSPSQKQIYSLWVWLISILHLAMISKQTGLALWFLNILESKENFELGVKFPSSFSQTKPGCAFTGGTRRFITLPLLRLLSYYGFTMFGVILMGHADSLWCILSFLLFWSLSKGMRCQFKCFRFTAVMEETSISF